MSMLDSYIHKFYKSLYDQSTFCLRQDDFDVN